MEFTVINTAEKMTETGTHVYFLNGPFSQWHPSEFGGLIGERWLDFHCAEQYMMARKAHLFGDYFTLDDIMAVEQKKDWREAPKACKNLGRQVRNFDLDIWNAHARSIVYQGNIYKFSDNDKLAKRLTDTGDKILVEGAHYDPVWGVGLAWNDPAILDEANWKGTNWLGKALMGVRDHING